MKATGLQAEPIRRIASRFALPVTRCAWLILMSAMCVAGAATEREYQTGKLIEVSDRNIDVGMPLGPIHLSYVLQIQTPGSIYSVYIDKRSYNLEWIVGNSIQFRTDKKTIFLRRLNGTELKAKLLGITPPPLGTLLPSVPSTAPPRELPLTPLKHHQTIPMGVDFLRGNNLCVSVSAVIDVGPADGSNGKPSRRESRTRNLLPDRTMVKILLGMRPCASTDLGFYLGPDELRHEFRFDNDFIQSLRFEGFWQKGFEMKTADLHVLTEAQVKWPGPMGRDANWWEYELEVRDGNASPAVALVVNVLSPDGRLMSRFSHKP